MSELNAKLRALDIPKRMRRLPVDERGWLVPWFVAWVDGKPDHRVVDASKLLEAIRFRRCWLCGDALGARGAFVLGPMCAVNRTNGEPPSHYECARFAVESCPFLTQPRAARRGDPMSEIDGTVSSAGCPIKRNPGAIGIWVTRTWRPFRPHAGVAGTLIELGEPERVEWYSRGRPATRDEVEESIRTGLPLLREQAEAQEREEPGCGALAALEQMAWNVECHLPAH